MLLGKNGREIPCICVTNRKLCRGNFLERIQQIALEKKADAILLREKDLTEEEYYLLAKEVYQICVSNNVPCIIHTFYRVARELGCENLHLPLSVFEEISLDERNEFRHIGTSIHSKEQLRQAICLGADYVTAGHVFDTDCKKGIPGRGIPFLREIVRESPVPVYGIGGINAENAEYVKETGAKGVCIMSGFMLETQDDLC